MIAGTRAMSPPLKEVNMMDMIRNINAINRARALTWAVIKLSAALLTIKFSPTMKNFMSGPAIFTMTSWSSSIYWLSVCESVMLCRTTILARR